MRTLRLSLVTAVTVMLLAGLATAAMVQEEADGLLVTRVSGTITDTSCDDSTAEITFGAGDVGRAAFRVEASRRPRLSAWPVPRGRASSSSSSGALGQYWQPQRTVRMAGQCCALRCGHCPPGPSQRSR
jgi:hypothetical protein